MEITQEKLEEINKFWNSALEEAKDNLNSIQRNAEIVVGRQEKFEADLRLKDVMENYHYHLPLRTEFVTSLDLPADKVSRFRRYAEFYGNKEEEESWEKEMMIKLSKQVIRTLIQMTRQPVKAAINLLYSDNPKRLLVTLTIPKEESNEL